MSNFNSNLYTIKELFEDIDKILLEKNKENIINNGEGVNYINVSIDGYKKYNKGMSITRIDCAIAKCDSEHATIPEQIDKIIKNENNLENDLIDEISVDNLFEMYKLNVPLFEGKPTVKHFGANFTTFNRLNAMRANVIKNLY